MPRKRVQKLRASRDIPLGVKIISILAYVGSGLMALTALLLLIGIAWLSSTNDSAQILQQVASGFGAISNEITAASVTIYAVLFAIVCILLAIVNFFVGRGLGSGKQWARVLTIIYAVIQVISGLGILRTNTGNGLFAIIFYGAIGAYLAFSDETKKFFK